MLGVWAIISGMSGVQQYVKIGAHTFVGGYTRVHMDVPAYVIAQGNPSEPRSINAEGLKRRDFSSEDISVLMKAFKTLYKRKLSLQDALIQLAELSETHPVVRPFYESVSDPDRRFIR